MIGNILECNVWCIADDEAENLGLPSGDSWMPFAIDLRTILAVKLCGPDKILKHMCKYYHMNLYVREWPEYLFMDCLFIRKDLI